MDTPRGNRHLALGRQASADTHTIGRDGRRETELAVEARPHARQETERTRENTEEAHERGHAHDSDQEAVQAEQEDTEKQRHGVVDGRQHGSQKLDATNREDAALGGLERGCAGAATHGRGHGIGAGFHGLVNHARGQGEQEGTQLVEAAAREQAELDARVLAAGDLNVEVPQANDAAEERIGDVHRLDARQARVALGAHEDTRAVPHGRRGHRVARHSPGQIAVEARDSQDHHSDRGEAEENDPTLDARRCLARQPRRERRRVRQGHRADNARH